MLPNLLSIGTLTTAHSLCCRCFQFSTDEDIRRCVSDHSGKVFFDEDSGAGRILLSWYRGSGFCAIRHTTCHCPCGHLGCCQWWQSWCLGCHGLGHPSIGSPGPSPSLSELLAWSPPLPASERPVAVLRRTSAGTPAMRELGAAFGSPVGNGKHAEAPAGPEQSAVSSSIAVDRHAGSAGKLLLLCVLWLLLIMHSFAAVCFLTTDSCSTEMSVCADMLPEHLTCCMCGKPAKFCDLVSD